MYLGANRFSEHLLWKVGGKVVVKTHSISMVREYIFICWYFSGLDNSYGIISMDELYLRVAMVIQPLESPWQLIKKTRPCTKFPKSTVKEFYNVNILISPYQHCGTFLLYFFMIF